jgi:hypothetical protein
MYIPVENQDSFEAMNFKGVFGGNRNIVKQTKSTGFLLFGVMT